MAESRTHFVQYLDGAIQSVDHDHFVLYLTEVVDGRPYLKRGFTEYSEPEARKLNPQLFGAPDPAVEAVRTNAEIAAEFERRRIIEQMTRLGGAA